MIVVRLVSRLAWRGGAEDAADCGARYVHSADEPLLIAGVATATLELLEREPSIETILVPVGGGSGAAGALPYEPVCAMIDKNTNR